MSHIITEKSNAAIIMVQQRTEWTKSFIDNNLRFHPNADKTVLQFIADFLYHGVPDVTLENSAESVRSTFRAGYCYYFAVMLQAAFQRGTICWAAPFGHIVWVDENDVPYDIEGVNDSECDYYIPISFMGNAINDFMHVEGRDFNVSDEDIQNIIDTYKVSLEIT